MGEKWLELKVMYCKDLKLFNFFQKLNVYALVSLVTGDEDKNEKVKKQQEQRTPTDTEGDANPEWNHEIRFDLGSLEDFDDDRLFLHFDLRSEANGILALGGDRCIGQVWVPLKDVVQVQPHGGGGGGIARFVNYEVRTPDDKSNGFINFSFKLNFKPYLPTINVHGYPIHHLHEGGHDQNPSSPPNLYPPSPSLLSSPSSSEIHYPSINMEEEFNETNPPDFYYDAVSSPVTPYSPQQGYYQYNHHHHPHQFSPLRPPPPPVAYPPQFSQPPPPPLQPVPYAYPPPPPQHHEYQASSSPNWAQYPKPPDPLYGFASNGGGGYDYCHGPGSPRTPIHFQPSE